MAVVLVVFAAEKGGPSAIKCEGIENDDGGRVVPCLLLFSLFRNRTFSRSHRNQKRVNNRKKKRKKREKKSKKEKEPETERLQLEKQIQRSGVEGEVNTGNQREFEARSGV